LDLRVGELFLLGFRGLEPPAWLARFAATHGLGGAILFDQDVATRQPGRNVESPAQVAALCAALHALPGRPLVFVDQEGGKVRRLKPALGFAELPSAAEFARLPRAERRAIATRACVEMKQLGIDFDLAPVADLDTRPDNPNLGALGRCFSADPEAVADNLRVWAEAAADAGLGLCLKHWPGLGGARVDSHLALTDITGTFSEAQLALFDLHAELPGGAILVSHGIVRDWDPDRPVSVSEPALRRLRARAPDALLISDDLQMQGLQQVCPTVESCELAIRAGVDLLCICNNLLAQEALCEQAAHRLTTRAREDAALRTRIEEARSRIAARRLWATTGARS
jgi:beta-N-acetylhexosaminidase